MGDDLYSPKVLALAASVPMGRLDAPDATARKVSRVCGSEVEVDVSLEDGRITAFAIDAKACALGQASAGIVAANIVGATVEDARALRDAVRAMLKEGGPPPGSPFDDYALLQAVKDYPQRHASTMLVLEAVVDCLDQVAAKESV